MFIYEYQLAKRRITPTELDSYIKNEKLDELHFLYNVRNALKHTKIKSIKAERVNSILRQDLRTQR